MLRLVRCATVASPTQAPLRVHGRHHFKPALRRSSTNANDSTKPILITTPIYYVNGTPHIGHLFSSLLADSLARWFRILGHKTIMSTGTDEHGLKVRREGVHSELMFFIVSYASDIISNSTVYMIQVQQAAEAKGISPQEWCDETSDQFKKLFLKAGISYDDYIRTTEPRHKIVVEHMWKILESKGMIYPGQFEGWYSVTDEAFLTPTQVVDTVGPDGSVIKVAADSGSKVSWLVEPNYVFKLSEFQQRLVDWIETSDVLRPANRVSEWLLEAKKGLRDLSVSRLKTKLQWGIPVPTDKDHVIYVWLDALTNYLTVSGWDPAHPQNHAWPADYHIIGKDIIKFHLIYWPAFLMAAGLPLPKKIIAHGHWTMNKEKMSKSKGNVVDPNKLIDDFGVDFVRYFLLRYGGIGTDGDFAEEILVDSVTAELANTFGNLLGRCTSAALNQSGRWPEFSKPTEQEVEMLEKLKTLPSAVDAAYRECEFAKGMGLVFDSLREINKYFADAQPWKLVPKKSKSDGNDISPEQSENQLARLETIVYLALEHTRIAALLLQPIIPDSISTALEYLGIPAEHRNPFKFNAGYQYNTHIAAAPGTKPPLVLFAKPVKPGVVQKEKPVKTKPTKTKQ